MPNETNTIEQAPDAATTTTVRYRFRAGAFYGAQFHINHCGEVMHLGPIEKATLFRSREQAEAKLASFQLSNPEKLKLESVTIQNAAIVSDADNQP